MSFESLSNLNASTAKHAKWIVRILCPRLIDYTFTARGELVQATKFVCLLVSEDPHHYLPATVPFSFQDRRAAQKAFDCFPVDSVWIMTEPVFDPKADRRFYSSSIPGVLLLSTCVSFDLLASL